MVNLEHLEIVRTEHWAGDTYLRTRYPQWNHEYAFIIRRNGEVKGQTSSGQWVDLSRETCEFIRDKINDFLQKRYGQPVRREGNGTNRFDQFGGFKRP